MCPTVNNPSIHSIDNSLTYNQTHQILLYLIETVLYGMHLLVLRQQDDLAVSLLNKGV